MLRFQCAPSRACIFNIYRLHTYVKKVGPRVKEAGWRESKYFARTRRFVNCEHARDYDSVERERERRDATQHATAEPICLVALSDNNNWQRDYASTADKMSRDKLEPRLVALADKSRAVLTFWSREYRVYIGCMCDSRPSLHRLI